MLLAGGSKAFAQQAQYINGTFQNLPFARFVEQVEPICSCRFYYNDAGLDSVFVTAVAKNALLSDLLQLVFSGTPFRYAIDGVRNVYVTRNVAIQTSLPENFFSRRPGAPANIAAVKQPSDTAGTASLKNNVRDIVIIGDPSDGSPKTKAVIAGYVRHQQSGEGIPGAMLYIDSAISGVITDQFGYYSIAVAPGRYVLRATAVGLKDAMHMVQVYADGKFSIEMKEEINSLKGVTVYSSRNTGLRNVQMGIEKLSIRTIRQIPALLGEVDVLRVVLALPGVTSVGEASTGFNVRGGAASQNLMLYDGATIYNPSHLFGFFSAYNPDMIKGVELYKSFIPEKYGGRLSSVLDVTTREGSQKAVSGNAGIGLLTSKVSLEGPLVKDKTSFILGGRTTYSNWLLKELKEAAYSKSAASFYDVDLHLQHKVNDKNSLFFTGYLSQDAFKLNNDTSYRYGNRNINIKWKHNFSNRFTGLFTAGADRYGFSVASDENKVNGFDLRFNINQKVARADFNYAAGNKHALSFGLNSVMYKLQPGSIAPKSEGSLIMQKAVAEERAVESAVYLGDQFTVNQKLAFSAGIRFSIYQYLGPQKVMSYIDGLPRSGNTVKDSTIYDKGKIIKTWMGPEVRFSARYNIAPRTAIKLGFNTLRQYIHMLSNTAAISPVDIWKLSDTHIRPQQGTQVSLGLYQNTKSNAVEISLEAYYRRIKHFLDYKSGAVLVLNDAVERDVLNTKGKAYGAELMIKKSGGKLNGWIAYTYSRSLLQMDDSLAGERINNGNAYPADFDKPHNGNLIVNYRFSHRFSASVNTVYSTGRPITLPIGVFELGGARRLLYGNRNSHRIPDYFRMDLSFNLEGNHRVKKKTHNSWSMGVYNLTGRKNVYSVYFVQEGGQINGYQLSIFGTIIPFITYNIRF